MDYQKRTSASGRWSHVVELISLLVTLSIGVTMAAGPPVFNFLPKTISLFENRNSSFKTMEGTATHPAPFTYTMDTSPLGGPFTIDSVTGEITVPPNPGFDFENISQYSLLITVDDGNSSATGTLTVNITNVNEQPTFDNLPGLVHIPEDTIPSYVLYNLLSTDPEGDPVTYSLRAPTNVPFKIQPSGVITLDTNPGLDYETMPVYRLLIEVADHEMHSVQELTIIVDDVNEPPKILNMGVTLTLPRETLGPVYYVQGVDEDLNDLLTYTFTSVPPSAFGDPFVLNPSTGELAVNNPPGLDPSVTNLYTLNVTLRDKEGFMDWGLLVIRIVDITDVPEIWNLPTTVFVKETDAIALKIFHARTIDMINGSLVYNMTVSPDESKFRITYKRGEIWYDDNPHFDFEKTSSYEISVTVSNGKKVSRAKSIYVIVKDVNEPPTVDNLPAALTLGENQAKAAEIFKVSGSDQDAGSFVTYNMTVQPSTGNSKFTLDPITGQISTVANPNFDFETTNLYMLKVAAFDGQFVSRYRNLIVHISNVNEPPSLPTAAITIDINEEEPIGYELPLNCTATDEDKKEKLTYRLAPTANSGYFALNATQGCSVTVAKILDSEDPASPSSVTLMITVTDSGGKTAAMSAIVNIINVNDHAPVFAPVNYLVHVNENEDVDAPVVSLNATDADSGMDGEILYNITTSIGRDYFDVSIDGEVTLGSHLDREDLSFVAFDVVASDCGAPPLSATASVTVVILDENDNRPQFLQSFYDFEARYDAAKGTVVGSVSAIDTDKPSKILEYSILGVSHDFEVGSVSGVIQSKQKLVSNIRYLLYIQAQDMGIPQEASEAVGVRIDTYVCEESLVRMDVYREPSFFDVSGKAEFTSAMRGLFPGFVARVGEVRSGAPPGTSEALVYLLRNNSTGSASAIYNQKEFVPVNEILKWTTFGSEGSPVAYLSSGLFSQFPVTKVSCECCMTDDVNWWLQTTEGQVTTGILSTIGIGLALAALSWLGMLAVGRCQKYFAGGKVSPPTGRYASKPPISTHKPQYGDGKEMNWWKLQPKAAFDENSPLEEKFRPPSQGSQASKGSGVKSTDVRAELTASEQPPDRSIPAALKPKPAVPKGLGF